MVNIWSRCPPNFRVTKPSYPTVGVGVENSETIATVDDLAPASSTLGIATFVSWPTDVETALSARCRQSERLVIWCVLIPIINAGGQNKVLATPRAWRGEGEKTSSTNSERTERPLKNARTPILDVGF